MSALLVAASRRWNTPTVVQSASTFGTAPLTVTLPGTVAGRTLIGVTSGNASNNLPLPSPWTLVIAGNTGTTTTARAHIWRRTSPGGDVVSTTGGSSGSSSLLVMEVDDTAPIALRTAQIGDAGADITSLALEVPAPLGPALVVWAFGANGTTTAKAMTGCTIVSPTNRLTVGYRVATGGAQSTTFSNTTARRMNAVVAAFRPTKT